MVKRRDRRGLGQGDIYKSRQCDETWMPRKHLHGREAQDGNYATDMKVIHCKGCSWRASSTDGGSHEVQEDDKGEVVRFAFLRPIARVGEAVRRPMYISISTNHQT